jgi:predicted alpha/beta-fold hydrolase
MPLPASLTQSNLKIAVHESIIPPFEPHPLVKGGHAQTILGRYLGGERQWLAATRHIIELPDGDRLLALETIPAGWREQQPVALLVHGLAGCAQASYVVRLGRRLLSEGIRIVRINLRGAGDGFGLAKGIYHAGRSDDLQVVLDWLLGRVRGSRIALVGFSLGANLVLKLAAETSGASLAALDAVLAANPPLDLAACARQIQLPENRLYDWNFLRWLRGMVRRLHSRFPELGEVDLTGVRTLQDFDDRYTAPRAGFASAGEYYERCSLVAALPRIQVPGLIVHAMDDPFVPPEPVLNAPKSLRLSVELVPHGGHLGYLSRNSWGGDHRWLDARLAYWLKSHWYGRVAG